MTEVITRNRVAASANARIRDRCNSGISWGTNNYPANSIPGWFGGTTAGRASSLGAGNFSAGEPSASQAAAVLRSFANQFGHIRTVRILIYRTRSGYASGNGSILIYNGTAVANTAYSVGNFAANAAMASLRDGITMNLSKLDAAVDELWSAYWNATRSYATDLANTICHDNCHDNCHTARGRR